MSCGNNGCNCNSKKRGMALCPMSLGTALGITMALASLIWSMWVMKYGVPATMPAYPVPADMMAALTMSLWCLVKGFIFGVVVALIYDLCACWCKGWCCKSNSCGCGCGTKPPEAKV